MSLITRRNALTLSCGMALTGCVFGSSTTQLDLSIAADPQLNPNGNGTSAPLLIKFYELVSTDAFGTATFSALFYTPNDVLRSDLLNTFSEEVTPSSQNKMKRTLDGQARFLGIVAGYRDISNAKWRLTKQLNFHGSNRVRLVAGRLAISYAPAGGWF